MSGVISDERTISNLVRHISEGTGRSQVGGLEQLIRLDVPPRRSGFMPVSGGFVLRC